MTTKILIVDDDNSLRKIVEAALPRRGFVLKGASNGTTVFQVINKWNPDIVIIGMKSIKMNGLSMTRHIREFSSIPIIMMAAESNERAVMEGLEIGVNDYIFKPFTRTKILTSIRTTLQRSHPSPIKALNKGILRHKDLLIDTNQARVTIGGKEIHLTANEFQLLVKLASSMGRVVTFDEILNSVWGHKQQTDLNALWITISRLRKKIEPDPKKPIHILHRKKIGYMMP